MQRFSSTPFAAHTRDLLPTAEFEANVVDFEGLEEKSNAQANAWVPGILDALTYGVVVADAKIPGLPIVHCNPAFEVITGYARSEVLGKNCGFLQRSPLEAPVPENEEVLHKVRLALSEQRTCDVVLLNFRKNGAPFWNRLQISPLRDASGNVTHFMGSLYDVSANVESERALCEIRTDLELRHQQTTEELARVNERLYNEVIAHKQTSSALRRADELYRGFVENAVVGIYQSTASGHYIEVNSALARMYGYETPAQLMEGVRNTANDLYVDPGVRAEFRRRLDADGEVQGMEYQVRRRDGTVIWISEHARAIRGKRGKVLRYEGVIRDISTRKKAETERANMEAQLIQAQKIEAIGTLAGGIAHDFNNILGAIFGFAELAASDLEPGTITHQNVLGVLQAGQRAKELVSQILAFSRHTSPGRKSVHVRPIVLEMVKLMRATLPSSIEVLAKCDLAEDIISADPVQIHQVLMNLCTNAGYAMEAKGGTLTVGLEAVDFTSVAPPPNTGLCPGNHLKLSVADTGSGMSPAVLERIFEPFYTTKPVGEGTGLGLSVVHGIVKTHGGDIVVESTQGRGTVFHLYFPLTEVAAAATIAPFPVRTGTERILLVDDDEALRNVLGEQLRRLHYRVSTSGDGSNALALFLEDPHDWDLVITDQSMPVMNGTCLAREMAAVRPDMPILLTTGNPERIESGLALAASVRDVLVKPMTLTALSMAVRDALEKQSPELAAFAPDAS
jgi:PAS domain S-box-containing protein